MEVTQPLVALAAMLIRRPALDCYEAFVDPAITSKFWFSAGSDRLDAGHQVIWTWGMYGVSSTVDVKELVPGHKIVIEGQPMITTRIDFLPPPDFPAQTFADFMKLGHIMTAVPAVNAIPSVVAASPGIVTYNDIKLPLPSGYVPR